MTGVLDLCERVDLDVPAIRAWTTTRQVGSFGLGSSEAVKAVHDRWSSLQDELQDLGIHRLATASQVHGADVVNHGPGWHGWLRMRGVDGHVTNVPGTALAVTVADCTPVFIAHPSGVLAVLHAGWRGTAAGILARGLQCVAGFGVHAGECHVHLGPSICGSCYEVGPEVLEAVTGTPASEKGLLDVRARLWEQAQELGVTDISVSNWCTRCHNSRFFSHRAGDEGRQLGIIALGA